AAHIAWADQPLVAVGMTLASGALTAATWWAGKDTKEARRLHALLLTRSPLPPRVRHTRTAPATTLTRL
ncbi:hypothetical protein KBZ21_39495, partial [Streptomyces sp. A73]|nr:hypothetical protein [Streptomyces sp. A73]